MPHGTFPIPPLPMRRTHSTFSTLLPQIYTLFSVAPCPASKYAILGASLQPPDNQPFTIQSFPRHLPNTPFPTTKRHLSALDLCPFEAPSLTFRTSIPKPPQPDTCPTPAPPLAYALSTRSPTRLRTLKISTPRPLFHPKFRHKICAKYLYPPPLCPTAKMIMRNVMGWVRTMRNTPQPEIA